MGIECEREGYRYREGLREVERERWGERGGETARERHMVIECVRERDIDTGKS